MEVDLSQLKARTQQVGAAERSSTVSSRSARYGCSPFRTKAADDEVPSAEGPGEEKEHGVNYTQIFLFAFLAVLCIVGLVALNSDEINLSLPTESLESPNHPQLVEVKVQDLERGASNAEDVKSDLGESKSEAEAVEEDELALEDEAESESDDKSEEKESSKAPASAKIKISSKKSFLGAKAKKNCTFTPDLLQYTLDKINNTKVTMKPYPHLFIQNVFKPSFYPCIVERLPARSATVKNYNRLPKGRYVLELQGKTYGPRHGKMNPNLKTHAPKFWTSFANMFSGAEMRDLWLNKFHPTLQHRSIDYAAPENRNIFFYAMDLGRDLQGYEIGPHTDTEDKWVTTLFYLPKTNSMSQVGTLVVKSKSNAKSGGREKLSLKSADFSIARRAKFIRNAVFAFAPCMTSWHAVEEVKNAGIRDTIQGFVKARRNSKKNKCG